MKLSGKLEYRDLEGGMYELTSDDGKRYTLSGSKSELKGARGARVEVEGEVEQGFGISMAGPRFRVSRLRKL